MKLHFHDLEGGGIAEDKRMINAKSPWTLAHLDMKILQGFYNNPAVPPSMKTKLKGAMMMKPSLKKKLSGGLAGVSKASGFIQRMMAENKLKHSGEYKKPTHPAHKDSTMSQWRAFDYKKLANKDQGGEGEAEYGASPFIQKYFKNGTVPFTKGNTAKETQKQKEARLTMMAKRLAKLARRLAREQPQNQAVQEQVQEAREAVEEKREEPAPVETPAELLEHFGNVSMGEPPVGLEVKPKEKSAEEATPANPAPKKRIIIRLKKKAEPVEEPPKNEIVSTAEAPPEPPQEGKTGSSHFVFVKPDRAISRDYITKGIEGHKHLQKKIAEVMSKHPDNILQWGTWQLYNFDVFIEGAMDSGYFTLSHFIPPNDLHRRGAGGFDYGTGKTNAWMKKLDIPEERVNPVSFLKLVRRTKARVEKFNEDTPRMMKEGAFERIQQEAGSAYSAYPLYPEKLSGANGQYPYGSRTFKTPAVRAYFNEFWDLHEDLYMYFGIQGLIPSQVYPYKGISEEECIKRCLLNGEDVIKDLDELISSLEKVQTKEAIKARMEALKEWSKFHLDWREAWLDTAEVPEGQPIPHTPDEIGFVRNYSETYRNENSKLYQHLQKQLEEEAKRRPPPKEEKVKVKARSGHSGSKREANIKKILKKTPKATLPTIAEALKELGDTGVGGKALSVGTLSPIVKKVRASIAEGDESSSDEEEGDTVEGEGHLRMCGV